MSSEAVMASGVLLETVVPDILKRYPQGRPRLDSYGLHGCGGRLGPVESLGFFARAHGVDQARLLTEVGRAIAAEPAGQEQGADAVPTNVPLVLPRVEDTISRRFFLAGIALILTAGASWGALLLWKTGWVGAYHSSGMVPLGTLRSVTSVSGCPVSRSRT